MDSVEAFEAIRDYWDNRAFDFDKDHDTEDGYTWKATLVNLLGENRNINVLDLGTGSGFLANMTAELGYPTVGIDFSREMMRNGVRHAEENGSAAMFIDGNALDTKFMDDSVDVVMNARLIWTLVDSDEMVREWLRILRPGGQLLCFNRMDRVNGLANKSITGFKYDSEDIAELLDTADDSMDDLIDLLEVNGYKDVEIRRLPGLTRPEFDYQDWYVLMGRKPFPQRHIEEQGIARYWNEAASRYEDAHALADIPTWQRVLNELIGGDKDAAIIDVATGTGIIANMLGMYGYRNVIGIDLSEQMMRIAIDHAREQHLNTPFIYGNAMELPLPDESVGVVINSRLMWTLSEPAEALAEWLRVLRPGGKVIAINEFEEDGIRCRSMDEYRQSTDVERYPFANTETQKILDMFEEAGYRDVEMIPLPGCHLLQDDRENWSAVTGVK